MEGHHSPPSRPIEQVLEGEAGGAFHRAAILAELQAAAEKVYDEFEHDKFFPPDARAATNLLKDYDFLV